MINLLKRFLLLVILFQSAIQATDTEEEQTIFPLNIFDDSENASANTLLREKKEESEDEEIGLPQKEVIPQALGPRKIETILGLEESSAEDQKNLLYCSNLTPSHSFFKDNYKYSKDWHEQQQAYIHKIDESFFHDDAKHKQNICSLRVTLIFNNNGSIEPISYSFDDFLFVSGKKFDRGEESLGILEDFDGKKYEVKVAGPVKEFGRKGKVSSDLEILLKNDTFLKRYNEKTKNKTIFCIADFHPNLEDYRTDIINFLDLKTVLGINVQSMRKYFEKEVEKTLPETPLLSFKEVKEKIMDIYGDSLNRAPLSKDSIDFLKIFSNSKDLEIEIDFCDSEQSIRRFLNNQTSKFTLPQQEEEMGNSELPQEMPQMMFLKNLQEIQQKLEKNTLAEKISNKIQVLISTTQVDTLKKALERIKTLIEKNEYSEALKIVQKLIEKGQKAKKKINTQIQKKEPKEVLVNPPLEKFQKVENEWRKFKELLKKFDINKIISIHIDIVSRRYMCSTCENSYNYDLNKPDANLRKAMVRGILANLRYDVLKELIAKIDFTFLVSGSIPHSKDNRR